MNTSARYIKMCAQSSLRVRPAERAQHEQRTDGTPWLRVRRRAARLPPEQVDAHAVDLSRDRDAAWERAARLTVLAREMGTELDRLRETVAGLTPQTYEALGGRARELYELGVEEATAVREGGRHDARRMVAEAEEAGLLLRGPRRRTPTRCAGRPRSGPGTCCWPPRPRPTICAKRPGAG